MNRLPLSDHLNRRLLDESGRPGFKRVAGLIYFREEFVMKSQSRKRILAAGLVALIASAIPGAATATLPVCAGGNSTATSTPGHPLGDWYYCITLEWGILPHALSHWNIILDLENCECACSDFPFGAADIAGTSDGEGDCTVSYSAGYHCDDPSIDGVEGPLVKFAPIEGECEPDKSGSGMFCFYSDWAPVTVSEPNDLALLKFATLDCTGEITGQLPGCTCGATSTETYHWGAIKSLFR
jgi:hypothetical protein